MAQNSKSRSEEIQAAAAALLAEKGVDVTERVEIRPLAHNLKDLVNCHYNTAKIHVARAVRRARGELMEQNWGGPRPNSGYPKGVPRKANEVNEVTVILSQQDLGEFLNDNATWMEQYRAELERRLNEAGYSASVEINRDALADKVLADDEDQVREVLAALMADMGNSLEDWIKQ